MLTNFDKIKDKTWTGHSRSGDFEETVDIYGFMLSSNVFDVVTKDVRLIRSNLNTLGGQRVVILVVLICGKDMM